MDNIVLDPAAPQAVPLAHLFGAPVHEMPHDLYIPPEALRVFLETFEGPLDLLLYLIRKQNINVLDIPMRTVTAQYLVYVEAMTEHQLELAAEYLLMAAVLIDIKSRLLLPRQVSADEEAGAEDPRAELVRRLLEYEQMKLAARALDEMPQAGRDFAWVQVLIERIEETRLPDVNVLDLREAWTSILQRATVHQHHQISQDELSVRETMSRTLARLRQRGVMQFHECFESGLSRPLLVVQLLAILELCKEALVEVTQSAPFASIFISLPGRDRPRNPA